jgi:hypothetical protein
MLLKVINYTSQFYLIAILGNGTPFDDFYCGNNSCGQNKAID